MHQLDTNRSPRFFPLFFMVMVLVGQINTTPYVGLDVQSVIRPIESMPASPKTCQAFFVTEPSGYAIGDKNTDARYRQNVEAMLIADHINLPTINGLSSFSPPDWDFSEEPQATYMDRVYHYVQAHHIDNICQYTIKNYTWETDPFSEKLQ